MGLQKGQSNWVGRRAMQRERWPRREKRSTGTHLLSAFGCSSDALRERCWWDRQSAKEKELVTRLNKVTGATGFPRARLAKHHVGGVVRTPGVTVSTQAAASIDLQNMNPSNNTFPEFDTQSRPCQTLYITCAANPFPYERGDSHSAHQALPGSLWLECIDRVGIVTSRPPPYEFLLHTACE